MAQVSMGYYVTGTYQDAQRDKTHRKIQLDVASMDDALTAAPIVLGYLTACTDAVLIGYKIAQEFENDTVSLATAGDVSQGAEILMTLSGRPAKSASFNVPAPKAAIFGAVGTANANVVLDPALSAPVLNLVGMFDDSAGECFISDGEHVATPGFIRGYRTPRKGGYRIA